MAGALIGRECVLAYNSNTFGSPTWTVLTRAIDVAYSIRSERGDVSSRVSIWKMEAKALNSLELTFGYRYRYNVSDTVFDALRAALLSNTKLEFAIADAAIASSGTDYLRATYQLEGNVDQALQNGVACEFTAFLTSEEDSGTIREPAWTTV